MGTERWAVLQVCSGVWGAVSGTTCFWHCFCLFFFLLLLFLLFFFLLLPLFLLFFFLLLLTTSIIIFLFFLLSDGQSETSGWF